MTVHRILFVTCLPLQEPQTASMKFMGVLLERYAERFTWFSLRSPDPNAVIPYRIPYAHTVPLRQPARIPWLKQYLNLFPWARHMGQQAADFGRSQKVEVVLADLAFEAVEAGRAAAQALNVPLLVNVHDDPVNRIKVKGYTDWLVKLYQASFAKTMRTAKRCGVISQYMGEIYQERYGVKTTTLYIGVEASKCLPIRAFEAGKEPVLIGSIGSMNSAENWGLLIEAVRLINSRLGRKKIQILHIGSLPDHMRAPGEVEVTGWVPEDEYLHHLSRIDASFLNGSFAPQFSETSKLSFPLKIHSYIQAQKPMLAFGPSDSAVVRFVQDYQCGAVCTEFNLESLSSSLDHLIGNQQVYEKAQTGVMKLQQVFSREHFFENFENFLQV